MIHKIIDGRYGVDEDGSVFSMLNNKGKPRAIPMLLKTRMCPGGYLLRLLPSVHKAMREW